MGRIFVVALTLLIGGGIGFGAYWLTRSTPTPVPERSTGGEEVVIELRVKLPAGAVPPNDFHSSSSTVHQNKLINTSEPLDMAIEGAGYFQVLLPSGEVRYTRDGSFGLNKNGEIITRQSFQLIPQITIPQDAVNVSVGADGTVNVCNPQSQARVIGQITLVRFDNPGWFHRDEHGLWAETPESGPPQVVTPGTEKCGVIRQGARERQAELDAVVLTDLVRAIVSEDRRVQVRVER